MQFFTRIPITGRLADWVGYSPELLRASAGHFPGVGVLVGIVAAAAYALLQAVLPDTPFAPLVAAALSTVATVLLTGGFHEDGLADVADGLGGSHGPNAKERAGDHEGLACGCFWRDGAGAGPAVQTGAAGAFGFGGRRTP
ncbi:adenosylcobinamide-GDP ribazoletransferase [Polaromonas sp. P1-6]|nr:adenosylcobinamide-GDP ribazoletransferase [Polaromonas sp. P1-6]